MNSCVSSSGRRDFFSRRALVEDVSDTAELVEVVLFTVRLYDVGIATGAEEEDCLLDLLLVELERWGVAALEAPLAGYPPLWFPVLDCLVIKSGDDGER